jgi:hypothetical protein
MRLTSFLLLAALAAVPAALDGQGPPSGWRVALDGGQPLDSTVQFQIMAPGWHLTMGPGGVVYHPRYTAAGRFSVEAEMFLFPGASDAGYGLFLGGTAVEDGQPAFVGFVLRRDGSAAVIRTDESGETVYAPWRRHDPIAPGGEEPVRNVLRVDAGRDSVHFRVNDSLVATVARNEVPVDGAFGFRIGQGINLHASSLSLSTHLAEPGRR